jgi:hypothetical protein
VRNGVYREAVKINGNRRSSYLRLIGNTKHPKKGRAARQGNMQNGDVRSTTPDEVHRSTASWLVTTSPTELLLHEPHGLHDEPLNRRRHGVYGLYAFNTIGGRMLNSEAYYANDGAFYIGRRRRRRSRCARSSATSTAGAARSASARPTCAT